MAVTAAFPTHLEMGTRISTPSSTRTEVSVASAVRNTSMSLGGPSIIPTGFLKSFQVTSTSVVNATKSMSMGAQPMVTGVVGMMAAVAVMRGAVGL